MSLRCVIWSLGTLDGYSSYCIKNTFFLFKHIHQNQVNDNKCTQKSAVLKPFVFWMHPRFLMCKQMLILNVLKRNKYVCGRSLYIEFQGLWCEVFLWKRVLMIIGQYMSRKRGKNEMNLINILLILDFLLQMAYLNLSTPGVF